MNDLTRLPPSDNSVRPTTLGLSPHLERLLVDEPDSAEAVRKIAGASMLVAECRDALPRLELAAQAPAGRGQGSALRMVIGRRFVLYPQPDRSEGEWSAWWADYEHALSEVPLASLEAAMSAFVKRPDAEFLPKPGQLLALVRTTPARPLQALERARAAVKASDQPAPRLNAPQTVDPPAMRRVVTDRDAVERMRASYEAEYQARPVVARVVRPPSHGPTDEGGLTAQMRVWLAGRNQHEEQT